MSRHCARIDRLFGAGFGAVVALLATLLGFGLLGMSPPVHVGSWAVFIGGAAGWWRGGHVLHWIAQIEERDQCTSD